MSHAHLSCWFVPPRTRRLFEWRLRLEIQTPEWVNKQLSQVPRIHHHSLGRLDCKAFESWRLCTVNDWQHYIGRVVEENQLQGRKWWRIEQYQGKSQKRGSEETCIVIHQAGIMEYTQWFEGKANNVADSISCDFHIGNDELTTLLHSLYPE